MAVYHFFYQVNDEAEMAEGDMATLKAQTRAETDFHIWKLAAGKTHM